MTALWSALTLKKLANAESNKYWEASGIEIDSRKVKKGDLFCAIKGEKNNGHDYIDYAFERGAIACLVNKDYNTDKEIAISKVNNVIETLDLMAKDSRRRSKAKFIAITGSVGKTGTKDMISLGLSGVADTYANESSYNNHLGVPLSLAKLPKKSDFCVLELGMNKEGEIRELAKLVKPEVAILTAIEQAHLKGLLTLKNIAKAKSEVLECLPADGCLIINSDTNYSEFIITKAKRIGIKNIITYGRKDGNNIKLVDYKINKNQYSIKALCFGKKKSWLMPIVGEHWIYNSLSILALANYYQIDCEKIINRIYSFKVPEGRGNNIFLKFKNKNFLLIDDSYNSNPASLKASLKNFSKLKVKGNKYLVLGDMLELGEKSLEIHKKFKEKIENIDIDGLYTTGKNMFALNKVICNVKYKVHEENLEIITNKILKLLQDGDAFLIKGSNSLNLNIIINQLVKACNRL